MRVPVELRRSYLLLNHGPTTLISSAANGRRNVMAAAWVMPIDFSPPKLAAVIAEGSFTRTLVDASHELVINVPTRALVDLTVAVGNETGAEVDKFTKHAISTSPASKVAAPLLDSCVAWLECRVVPEPEIAKKYDLFVLEVLAAWADDAVFDGRMWRFTDDAQRTIHHLAKGHFVTAGEVVTSGH